MVVERITVFAGKKAMANFLALLWVFVLSMGAVAQEGTKQDEPDAAGAELTASKQTAAPGETLLLKVKLKLAAGAHANSNSPADPLLIPTVFIPKKSEDMEWGAIEYPEPTEAIAAYSPTPLEVFEDGAEIMVSVKVSDRVKEDTLRIEGSLRIQVCDAQQCYPPKRIPLSIAIKIRKGDSPQRSRNGKSE